MVDLNDVDGIATEVQRIVAATQAEWDRWYRAGALPPADQSAPVRSEFGSIDNYMDQVRQAANDALTPPVPPAPPAVWHGPAAGVYAAQRYGSAARQWGNLTIPSGPPKGVLVQVHGGGWLQGDPNVALEPPVFAGAVDGDWGPMGSSEAYRPLLSSPGPDPSGYYGLRAMASYAASRWGVIVWEPAYAYSTGTPDACLADVRSAIHWLYSKLQDWGGLHLPVVYAGHSAGGHLSLRAALDPSVPAPRAWLGMAAAGLSVHRIADVQDAPGGFAVGGSGWIFTTAWGPAETWPDHAPDTHLSQRSERFPLYVEQGNLNGHDDGSVNVKWARDFVARTNGAWPTTYGEQPGADHFSVRWDESAITRGHMDAIWASV
jgi:acetyl esterase/lipase